MNSFATRRRADEFAAAADGVSTRGTSESRYDDLLALVGALRAVPPPPPRAEFVTELRSRLVAEAATLPAGDETGVDRLRAGTPAPARVRRLRERRLAVALGGLALVAATATMSV